MSNRIQVYLAYALFITIESSSFFSCASSQPIKSVAYAKLPNKRVFEYEFPEVWKAIETTFKDTKVISRDPQDVEEIDLMKMDKRTLETDWIYSESRDKYVEYRVNQGAPQRKKLQTRIQFQVIAKSVLGGTEVTIEMSEEIEKVKPNGSPDGFQAAIQKDTSRPYEMLEKIQQAILAMAP